MAEPLRVLLVTTWDTACGIAEHSRMLKEAVEAADPDIAIVPYPEAVADPERARATPVGEFHVLHLNYHAALHSRWTPAQVAACAQDAKWPTLITYHDTGVPNSDHCKMIIEAADVAVVHEPFDDLPAEKTYYWRMGVCDALAPWLWEDAWRRPLLGTVGFPFPWKCYDELCRVTAAAGWGLVLLAPTATEEDIRRWKGINPHAWVETAFLPRHLIQAKLAGCDATAFTYVCHNTGQSGAILQGIAARKPVIALATCRQFRALYKDPLGRETIRWAETFGEVEMILRHLPIQRVDPGIVALAEQESWRRIGVQYATLYRRLVEA